jgi:branched-chain amino acid transport system ATP-binding protein
MSLLLSVKELSVQYGNIKAINNVCIDINKGELITIIGANGAGKTTILKALSGLIPTSNGQILYKSINLTSKEAYQLPNLGISHVPEGRRIFPKLTVIENLEVGGFTVTDQNIIHQRLLKVFELFPILAERKSQFGGTLSGGEQQMLAIGRSLMIDPELLLLDEPSMGVAPIFVDKIFQTLQLLNKTGTTILLVEQNAKRALSIADRAYVLENGFITMTDKANSILNNPKVIEAYLGA